MMMIPTVIDTSIPNVTFTQAVGEDKYVISQPIIETNGEPHDLLLQVVNSYEPLVWWLIHLTIMILAAIVVGMSGRRRRRRRTTSMVKTVFKKKIKPLIAWIMKFYLTIVDRTQFEASNRKLTFIFGATLIGIFLFNIIGMNDLGTKLIVPTSYFFDSMSDLLMTPPGEVKMTWICTSNALTYFTSQSNMLANKIYQKHIATNKIISFKSYDVNQFKQSTSVMIESGYIWSDLSRYLCIIATNYFGKVIKWRTVTLGGMKPIPVGYIFNHEVKDSVLTLVDQWYVISD